jgi:hypothetical protein
MAEKLVDMSYSAKELKAEKKEMSVGYDGSPNPYPWGLCLRLEDKELSKLGITTLPEVGTEMAFEIMCKVTSVSQEASETRQAHRCVALQITAMAVDDGVGDKE